MSYGFPSLGTNIGVGRGMVSMGWVGGEIPDPVVVVVCLAGDAAAQPLTAGGVRAHPATSGDVRLAPTVGGSIRAQLTASGAVRLGPTVSGAILGRC